MKYYKPLGQTKYYTRPLTVENYYYYYYYYYFEEPRNKEQGPGRNQNLEKCLIKYKCTVFLLKNKVKLFDLKVYCN
jgi:hypothetical protein